MSGYQRFIAYVYEYRNGKKEQNCGFVKVEVRNERCIMELHLQVKGIPEGEVCRAYCFVRKEGLMNGILIGSASMEKNGLVCVWETDAKSIGGMAIPFEKIGGMVFVTLSGCFFGTEWDDQPIKPENFKEYKLEKQGEKEKNRQEPKIESRAKSVNEPKSETESESKSEPEAELGSETKFEPEQRTVSEVEGISEQEDLKIQSAGEEKTVLSFGQEFTPFADEDSCQCWMIHPQDLIHFPRRQCALRNNRFLQYGYCHFGHLLLCRNQNGCYILGIPGCYDQQEQFMAGMFGFSCFKESPLIKTSKGRGGYWYRTIDPPEMK